jgi:glycosyltransferase involved in cell wall biosynthesis
LKINFISYLNPFRFHGGGEVVNRQVIEAGLSRGHTITLTSARNALNHYDESADLDFLCDVFNFPETLKSRGAWVNLKNSLLQKIIRERPFIHMTNAYADVCNLGYLPCSGDQSSPCQYKSPLKIKRNIAARDFKADCFATNSLVREAYLNSLLNVYVSPLHRRITNRVLQIDDVTRSIVLRPIIDTNDFYNRHYERDIEYLFVGVLSEAKGFQQLREIYSDKDLVIAGEIHPNIKLDFGKFLGKLPYSEIPNLMNRAKNFVFLPRWPEPQGRVVVEAALSGCKLITNENVGALSFPFDISLPENLSGSADRFWDELEGAVWRM